MSKPSKRQKALSEICSKTQQPMEIEQCMAFVTKLESSLPPGIKPCRFDQTVEIAVRLGVDPKQADQIVRGAIVLPHGLGTERRVIVFTQGDKIRDAETAGAIAAGGKDLADRIKAGWLDFDVAIASPDMMGVVGPLGKLLGPRGLMPSPKAGTVTNDVAQAVREYKAGKLEFRVDSAGIIHAPIGKLSFEPQQLTENATALIRTIVALKPQSAKGVYVRSATISATMTPGISIKI